MTRQASWARRTATGLLLTMALLATPLAASAHDYDPEEAAHPLRIAAYVLHPVGVALDYGIARPFHWLVSREPWRTIFGHTERDG